MSEYRKKMFRGAKIEDCIIDFIEMEKELSTSLETTDKQERQMLLGMSKALRLIVNRLVREFDYTVGGDIVNAKLKDFISSIERRANEAHKQGNISMNELLNNMYYDDIPDEAKEEIAKMPTNYQKGLWEGMALGYEKIIVDLQVILHSDANNKVSLIKINSDKFEELAAMFKDKWKEDEMDYRSGFMQGEMSAYTLISIEMKEFFSI
ncbi:hypothetical protein NQZ71_25600 (plasmid) [Niallia taxi]|uniref:hypothetical protein n=1 Tax=Niallia taxi TaxID=2499688 RepID=UPI002934A957|nr:hypothetical protein [Niallia taxi]WOD65267.1 hypothetical protein NQZ71_25600 [Niallia taxi]